MAAVSAANLVDFHQVIVVLALVLAPVVVCEKISAHTPISSLNADHCAGESSMMPAEQLSRLRRVITYVPSLPRRVTLKYAGYRW